MIRLVFVSMAAAVLIGASPTAGFVPLTARAAISTRPSNILKAATFGGDISFDVERARECADSFGECSIEDMERMKNALHAERIANFLTAKSDPSWPEAELQDRILEDDLDMQLKNLKAYYINDPRVENLEMPGQQRAEKLHSDMEMMDHPISVPTTDDVYGATPEAQHTASPWLERVAENAMSSDVLVGKRGSAMSPDVLIRNSESVALLATLMIIMLLPEVVHHGMK